ncbi:MAG: Uma2 family endonuclease [Cyclobacteriaceae bacterium]
MEVITKRKLSIEEYHRMAEVGILAPEERVELIDGEIITMSPIGKEHLAIVGRINALLTPMLAGKHIVFSQSPVIIHGHSEPEPDLMVVPFRDDFYASTGVTQDDVLLIIEVSDSTLQKDLEVKLPLYARAGIAEAWIIDIKSRELHQYVHPEKGSYLKHQRLSIRDEVSSSQLQINLRVKDLLG